MVSINASADDLRQELTIDGRTRSFLIHLPPADSAKSALPLVVALHGGGGNAASVDKQTGLDAEADRSGFVVAYPNGSARPFLGEHLLVWNAGSCCGYAVENQVDDVGFVRALVARMQRSYRIDPTRIYATGLSNGGMMAYRLACEASDLFAAIAPVSAVDTGAICKPAQPVSVIHFHGSADQHVPLAGGVGNRAFSRDIRPPVANTIAFWVRHDGCNAQPEVTVSGAVRQENYKHCKSGTAVAFYLIEGGSHDWPGRAQVLGMSDKPSSELSATPIIWNFFAAHPRQ